MKDTNIKVAISRFKYFKYFIFFLFILIVVKLSIISFSGYFKDFQKYSNKQKKLIRYNIVDRNNKAIALTIPSVSIYLRPREIKDKASAIKALNSSLSIDINSAEALVNSSSPFVWVKHNITKEEERDLRYDGVIGIYFKKGYKRFYPYGSLFSHIIGMVDLDNIGISGVEKQFNDDLYKGDLILSLDLDIQRILYGALTKAYKNNGAKGAYGIISDAKTSEVLGIVSLPDFNPNFRKTIDINNTFNFATQGIVEPGSIMKVFSAAIALDNERHTIYDKYDVSKPIVKDSFLIVDTQYIEEKINIPEIIMYSSNIGTSILMNEVGRKTQYQYLKKLRLFEKTSLEVPENQKSLLPSKWSELTGMSVSYGYGVGLTLATFTNSFSAIINGGIYRPFTLLKTTEKEQYDREKRVLSQRTSQEIRSILRLVVSTGSGRRANVKGYNVAGKTGSAEKQINGKYSSNNALASFVGFFPVEDPKYIISIIIDEPRKNSYNNYNITGGNIAAPVIYEVVESLGLHFGINKNPDKADFIKRKDQEAIYQFIDNMPKLRID